MQETSGIIGRLSEKGYRLTPQRLMILSAIEGSSDHISAEEIYAQVAARYSHVNISTVYRTLERLRDLRILSQTDLGRGCAEYELVTDRPHHHLVCQGCGQVIDLDHTYVAMSAEVIRRDFGFEPFFDHFAIFGWCRECRKGGDGQGIRCEE